MRILLLALLLPAAIACESGQRSNDALASADAAPAARATAVEQAAQRACSVYGQAPLWDARDVDTNGDGARDFTEVFPAAGSKERVARIASSAAAARQEPKFAELAAAADFLVLVYNKGGDRSEVLDAEAAMARACNATGTQQE